MKLINALSHVSLISHDLPTSQRRDSGGSGQLPEALSLEMKVLLCFDVAVWALRRHSIALESGEPYGRGLPCPVLSGPQCTAEPVGQEQAQVCSLSSVQGEPDPGWTLRDPRQCPRPVWTRQLI